MSETHPTDLLLAMFADGEINNDAAQQTQQHLESCKMCQTKVKALTQETAMILSTLHINYAGLDDLVIPKFKRPANLKGFAMANIATGLLVWLAQFLWKTLFGELFMSAVAWISSVYVPGVYAVATTTALYFLQEGTAMFDTYFGLITLVLLSVATLWLLVSFRRKRALGSLCLCLLVGATLVAPSPATALVVRQSEGVVSVAASETIDDTLVAVADAVLVKGHVSGDLIAAGRRIDIEGSVAGNVLAFGETVTISGTVGGMVLNAGSNVTLRGAVIGGNWWAAAEKLSVDTEVQISSNAIVAGANANLAGSIAKDLFVFTELLEFDGKLGRDLEAYSNRVRLLDQAHIVGDTRLHISKEEALERSPGARLEGEVKFLDLPKQLESTNQYQRWEYYFWQAARLLSAILVGMALLWLVPGLRNVSVSGGLEGMKSAGIGIIALAALPIISVVAAITLVGLPFTIVGLFAWVLTIYLAKIIVGIFVGQLILGNVEQQNSNGIVLLVGLAAIIVSVNLPFIGSFINFALTILGAGLIVQYLMNEVSGREVSGRDVSPSGSQ